MSDKWLNRLTWIFLLTNPITLPTAIVMILTGEE